MHKHFLIAALATVHLSLLWSTAAAIDWTVKREPGLFRGQELITIKGDGEIVPGDAERLRLKLAGIGAISNAAEGPHPTVYLDSPGGDVVEGVNIGWVIREFDLGTFVAAEAGCYSACTFAFLGGTDRRVLGEFGIHAMSSALPVGLDDSASDDKRLRELLDTLQGVSAYLVSYAREMTGSSRMAEEALKFGSAGISRLDDGALRDWQIVTYAARPTQRYKADAGLLSKCDDIGWLRENAASHFILCEDLTVSRQYIEISDAMAELKGRPLAVDIAAEQERWDGYWEACEASIDLPTWIWHRLIENCVKEAFDLRSRELRALGDYYGVGAAEPAKSGWKVPE